MTASSNKKKRPWYCPCCGGKYNAGKYLARRLMVIVPPSSKYSVKNQTKAAESDNESQASTQAATAASSAN
eukprot:9389656-Prorocentrum_lima.AAC.1